MALSNLLGDISTVLNMVASKLGAGSLSTLSDPLSRGARTSFTFGTGALKANAVYYTKIIHATAAAVVLNLASLTDAFGDAFAFAKVKAIYIKRTDALAGTVEIAGLGATGADNPWLGPFKADGDTIVLREGSTELLLVSQGADGWAVSSGSKNLSIAAVSTGATIEVVIVGEKV